MSVSNTANGNVDLNFKGTQEAIDAFPGMIKVKEKANKYFYKPENSAKGQ